MFLVLAHEFGHFITAKKRGVKVLEFGIGIPPKVCRLRTDKSGTAYTLNLLPLWGFVRLKGEDPKDPVDFNAKDSFITAKIGSKILVLLAGIGMNVIVAWLFFSTVFFLGTKPMSVLPENAIKTETNSYLMPTLSFLQAQGLTSGNIADVPLIIEDILSWGIASHIGLQTWDRVLSINNQPISIISISSVLKTFIGKPITLDIQRGKQKLQKSGTCGEEDCMLGISFISTWDLTIKDIKFPLGRAMLAGLQEIKAETILTFDALGTLGKNFLSFNGTKISWSLNKLTGPVGVVKFGERLLAEGGWKLYLAFAGMISLALAIFNVIPLPALDGGRLLGVLIQWAGRLKAEKYFTIEWYINFVFFVLLMGLGIYIILKDLIRFRGVHIPFLS